MGMSILDVGVAKQSGCVRDWWLCSRWRTGQRLANLMSLGIPTVVWGDAQGHIDIVEARWPPRHVLKGPSHCEDFSGCYPQELVVTGESEVPKAMATLFGNS